MSVAPLLISAKVFSTTIVRTLLMFNFAARLGLKRSSSCLTSPKGPKNLSSSITRDETVPCGPFVTAVVLMRIHRHMFCQRNKLALIFQLPEKFSTDDELVFLVCSPNVSPTRCK